MKLTTLLPLTVQRGKDAKSLAGRRALAHLASLAKSAHVLAVLDQGIVSATNFVSMLLVARYASSSDAGRYSVILSLIAIAIALQDSFVLRPYSVLRHKFVAHDEMHVASQFFLAKSIVAALALTSLTAALVLSIKTPEQSLKETFLLIAFVTPASMIREFCKQIEAARLRVSRMLMLDLAVCAVQLAVLAIATIFDAISAQLATAGIGLSCAVGSVVWLVSCRIKLRTTRQMVKEVAIQNLQIGKWLVLNHAAALVHGWIILWLLFLRQGASQAGVFAACVSIVAFSNPVLFGLDGIFPGRSSAALANGGGKALRRQVIVDTALLGSALAAFCVFIALAGQPIMSILYPGPEYQGNGATLVALGLSALATAVGLPASNALVSAERPRLQALSTVLGTAAAVLFAVALMAKWSLFGATLGLFLGNAVGAMFRITALLLVISGSLSESREAETAWRTI